MQIVSIENNLHDMSNIVFWEKQNKKKHFKVLSAENFTQNAKPECLLKILPRVLSMIHSKCESWQQPTAFNFLYIFFWENKAWHFII